jgi:ribose transport system permease protein
VSQVVTGETEVDAQKPDGGRSNSVPLSSRLLGQLPRFGMVGLLGVLIVVFSVLRPESFATTANAKTVLLESAVLTILALAVMIPLIANDFDLSVAAVLGLASVLAAGLPSKQGLPVVAVIVLIPLMGALIGLVHGILIVRFGLSPVVVTLGSSTFIGGIVLWYTGGSVLYEGVPEGLTKLGNGDLFGVSLPIVYMVVVAAALWFVLERRPWGRSLYATGSSEVSARLAGVKTAGVRITALVACSSLAALAGLILTARIGSGNPSISGAFFLPAFAAAFLSLAAFKLGFFNPLGVVLAVYLLAVGVNGLSLLGAPSWVDPMFNGVALIAAIGLARASTGSSRKLFSGT